MTFDRDPKFIGSRLLALGFRAWFLYLFKYINGSPFIEQELHKELFEQVERTMRREDTRICINLSPRSGKTTINIWMVVYILTVNPKAQIIYTSFNQDLLRQIAQQVQSIMTNPIYQAMYGTYVSEEAEEVEQQTAETATEILEEKILEFSVIWNDDKHTIGSIAHLKAEAEDGEEIDIDSYKLQWQYSKDDEEWVNVEGANGKDYDVTITLDNFKYYWRVLATRVITVQEHTDFKDALETINNDSEETNLVEIEQNNISRSEQTDINSEEQKDINVSEQTD